MELFLFGKATFEHDAELAVDRSPVTNRQRPFSCSFKGGQVQGLEQSLVAGEHASLAVKPAVRRIQTFNRIGRVDELTDVFGELVEWCERIPVCVPALHGVRILGVPFLGYAVPNFCTQRFLRGVVDVLQVVRELLAIFVCHILERVANLVYKAALVFRLWEGDGYGFLDAGQSIGADDEYVLNASVLQFACFFMRSRNASLSDVSIVFLDIGVPFPPRF